MTTSTAVVAALAPFGLTQVGFLPVPETSITAIRLTDQPYDGAEGIALVGMIAREIIAPLGLSVSSYASNARYEGDDAVGAAIFVHDLEIA